MRPSIFYSQSYPQALDRSYPLLAPFIPAGIRIDVWVTTVSGVSGLWRPEQDSNL